MPTVYVSIGNSDDRLTQAEWHDFHDDVSRILTGHGAKFHGQWVSPSTGESQNACWCFEVPEAVTWELRSELARLAEAYRQDAISWAEVFGTPVILGSAGRSG